MISAHQLTQESVDALFMGAPDDAGLSVINASQRSKHLLLLRMVVDRLPTGFREGGVATEALAVLERARVRDQSAFDRLIGYPYVAASLVWCDRQLRAGQRPELVVEVLAALAAAAAIAVDDDFELDRVPVRGPLHLPGLGTCRLNSAEGTVRLAKQGEDVSLAGVVLPADLSRDTATWTAMRTITSAIDGFAPAFDDLHPHRGTGMPVAPRSTSDQFAGWQDVFTDATQILDKWHRVRAAQIGAVVQALTPLLSERPGQGRSASAWQAYGAIAATMPGDSLHFAATLLHETQHSLFNGLLDLFELYDPADTALYYSPWRADPRPLRGIFHGCYAFVGVADFWTRECADGVGGPRAEYELARTRVQVRRALDTLDGSAALTADGRHLVAQMARYLESLAATPSPDRARHLADLAAEDHRLSWRLRIVVPDPDLVRTVATTWREGRPTPALPDVSCLATGSETFVPNTRIRLFGRLAGEDGTAVDSPVPAADRQMAEHDHLAAAHGYRDAVLAGTADDLAAWTGLALAAARLDGPAGRVWHRRPELVRAVYQAAGDSSGEPSDPLIMAAWLARGMLD